MSSFSGQEDDFSHEIKDTKKDRQSLWVKTNQYSSTYTAVESPALSSTLHALLSLNALTLEHRCYLHFVDKETEAQRFICRKSSEKLKIAH